MKGLSKVLSVLLILAACFGVYGSVNAIQDISSSKAYWEKKGEEASADLDKLEDGISQLGENEQAYIDGVDKVAQGESDLAKGKSDLAAGKAELDKGRKDLAAGEKKLADGKASVAAGEKQIAEGKAALAALQPLLTSIQQYQALYKANGIESKYATALNDSGAIKNQINTYANTLVQAGQMLGEDGASLVTAGNGLLANLNGLATDPTAKSAPVAAFAQRANAQNSATDIGFNPILKQVSAGLAPKIEQIEDGLSQINAGMDQINAGLSQINAGISQRALTFDTDIAVDRKVMETNFFGPVLLTKMLASQIRGTRPVRLAVTTSISGLFGFPLRSAYCASKHALFGFFESLEIENPNVRVTFLIPGRINTPISKSALHGDGRSHDTMDQGQANGMDVDACAKVAVKAIARGRHRKLIGKGELIIVYIKKLCPWLFFKIAGRISAT